MAFKFTKQEENRRSELRDIVAEARAALDEVVAKETATIEDSYSAMNVAIEKYTETTQAAQGFFDDIHSEREGEWDDKSEKWQEGERGDAARNWIDAIGEVRDQLDPIDSFCFDPPAMDFEDHSDLIDNAPSEAEY